MKINWKDPNQTTERKKKKNKVECKRCMEHSWMLNVYVEHGFETEFEEIMSEMFQKWWTISTHKFKKLNKLHAQEIQRKTSSKHIPIKVHKLKIMRKTSFYQLEEKTHDLY